MEILSIVVFSTLSPRIVTSEDFLEYSVYGTSLLKLKNGSL